MTAPGIRQQTELAVRSKRHEMTDSGSDELRQRAANGDRQALDELRRLAERGNHGAADQLVELVAGSVPAVNRSFGGHLGACGAGPGT